MPKSCDSCLSKCPSRHTVTCPNYKPANPTNVPRREPRTANKKLPPRVTGTPGKKGS